MATCSRIVPLLCYKEIVGVEERVWPLVGSSSVVIPQVGLECPKPLVVGVKNERRREFSLSDVTLGRLVVGSTDAWVCILLQRRERPRVIVV